ncbi:L-lactate dehydrogenase, partial [Enterococcus faecalis]
AIINRQGVKQVIEIPLTDAEQEKMEASATALK